MDNKELVLIKNDKAVEEKVNKSSFANSTNPIVKKFNYFNKEKTPKFSVKDIFKL
ncbi:MAG: hypothetical protein R3Y28_00835 [Candidatus Gastranaerophilales bacterium]